jgi:hypothetical protein
MNVMLEKILGLFLVMKLRTILLYDAEFNMSNKNLGRRMMAFAEKHGGLAEEQYGSRKCKTAIAHCLNKRLTFDILRQQRRPGALLANDAKSCYDRIVHSVASICMQRLGVPKQPIQMMFRTIEDLEHFVRTIYGDSEISFGGSGWIYPCQGVGQGNGAGPPIWAFVSTPLFDKLRAEGHGASFQCPCPVRLWRSWDTVLSTMST